MILAKENNSRMEVATMIDKELRAAFSLKRTLEAALTDRQETATERQDIRKDLRECNLLIKELVKNDNEQERELNE